MLRPQPVAPIPEDTARVARAAIPPSHPYLRVADELGALFTDEDFAPLFPAPGQPATAPWRLALVTLLQFAEGLSDRQAAHALRTRIDWKYVARLDLTDPGVDGSVLSEFRGRLVAGAAEALLFDKLLHWCRARKLFTERGRQRTDSTHVLASVRLLNRVELARETMRHALDSLAVVAPAWLQPRAHPAWVERYTGRSEERRIPTGKDARVALALAIGADGDALLPAIYAADAAPVAWLRRIPAVNTLRKVWLQNYYHEGDHIHWRTEDHPAAVFVSSPHDPDAHYAKKGATEWVGYKVHLTETCEDSLPPLITHVETTAGPVADGDMTPVIHQALEHKRLLSRTHLVDTGYLDAALLVSSERDFGVDLYGPTRADYRWQSQAGAGFAAKDFHIDWQKQQAICPEGRTSIGWTPAIDKRDNEVIKIKFSTKDCRPCPSRALCYRATGKYQRRLVTVRRHPEFLALSAARQRESADEFAATYAPRAGIEGTLSRGVRRCRLRRTRYVGHARVHLGHVLTAAAINFVRLGEWFTNVPRPKTRPSSFALLMAGSPAA